MNRHLIVTVVVSNVFFWCFLGFGVYFWQENREVKVEAEQHYQKMLAANDQCNQDNLTIDVYCRKMATERQALDKKVTASSHYDSLTRLFLAFGIFIPLVTWASYFLTRAIFA